MSQLHVGMRRREDGNACGRGGGCERNYTDSDNVTIHLHSLGRENLFGFSLGISVEEEEEDVRHSLGRELLFGFSWV